MVKDTSITCWTCHSPLNSDGICEGCEDLYPTPEEQLKIDIKNRQIEMKSYWRRKEIIKNIAWHEEQSIKRNVSYL